MKNALAGRGLETKWEIPDKTNNVMQKTELPTEIFNTDFGMGEMSSPKTRENKNSNVLIIKL